MKRAIPVLAVALLVGCAQAVELPVDPSLTHDEVVDRVEKLLKDEHVTRVYDLGILHGASEKRLSATATRLKYLPPRRPSEMNPALPDPGREWTNIDIDTARPGFVRIVVRSYRRGAFVDLRQPETESRIVRALAVLQDRADRSLQPK